MKTRFELQSMAAGEIMQYVPVDTFNTIKQKDDHPLFRAYVIGEEGPATPVVVGLGGRVLNWLRSAVSAMVSKLQFGTKIFHEHEQTNSHAGRTPIGEIVGKSLEYVAGKMRAVAVAYIYPQFRGIKADAASIEAQVELDPSGNRNDVADVHVGDISAVAVFDSQKYKPAFAGAGLISQLQAWAGEKIQGGGSMTIEEVKEYCRTARVRPSEIFDSKVLVADEIVAEHIRESVGRNYARMKSAEEALDALKKEAPGKIATLENQNKELNRRIATMTSKDLSTKLITERKLDGEKKVFVEKKLKEFELTGDKFDETDVKNQLDKFLDKKVEEFNELEVIFRPKADGGDKNAAGGSQNTAGGASGKSEPGKNPLLNES